MEVGLTLTKPLGLNLKTEVLLLIIVQEAKASFAKLYQTAAQCPIYQRALKIALDLAQSFTAILNEFHKRLMEEVPSQPGTLT